MIILYQSRNGVKQTEKVETICEMTKRCIELRSAGMTIINIVWQGSQGNIVIE